MKILFTNRYVEALGRTILFFASTHLVILTYIALRGNMRVLNAFNILSLDYFLPELGKGVVNFILSYCMVLAVYLPIYLALTKSPRKTITHIFRLARTSKNLLLDRFSKFQNPF